MFLSKKSADVNGTPEGEAFDGATAPPQSQWDEENVDLSRARLRLVAAAQSVLATTLSLMGMNAPDRM